MKRELLGFVMVIVASYMLIRGRVNRRRRPGPPRLKATVGEPHSSKPTVLDLRSLRVHLPPGWNVEHPRKGGWAMTPPNGGFLFSATLEFLHQTDIDTPEKYLDFAVEFAKSRGKLASNAISSLVGVPCTDFTIELFNGMVARQLTIPYRGTEYTLSFHFPSKRDFSDGADTMRHLLESCQIKQTSLPEVAILGGSLTARLPVATSSAGAEGWTIARNDDSRFECVGQVCETEAMPRLDGGDASSRRGSISLRISRVAADVPLTRSASTFEDVFDRNDPRRKHLEDPNHIVRLSFSENGSTGFGAFELPSGSHGRAWLAAVLTLPGRIRIGVVLDHDGPQDLPAAAFPGELLNFPFFLDLLSRLEAGP